MLAWRLKAYQGRLGTKPTDMKAVLGQHLAGVVALVLPHVQGQGQHQCCLHVRV